MDTGDKQANVALKSRARGRTQVRQSYEALFRAFPDLSPTSSSEAYGDDVFVTWGTVRGTMAGPVARLRAHAPGVHMRVRHVVRFQNGRMQGEQLFFDLPALCRGIGLVVDDVVGRASAAEAAT